MWRDQLRQRRFEPTGRTLARHLDAVARPDVLDEARGHAGDRGPGDHAVAGDEYVVAVHRLELPVDDAVADGELDVGGGRSDELARRTRWR